MGSGRPIRIRWIATVIVSALIVTGLVLLAPTPALAACSVGNSCTYNCGGVHVGFYCTNVYDPNRCCCPRNGCGPLIFNDCPDGLC